MKYRVVWVGANCLPFIGEAVTLKEAYGYAMAGEGHIAAIVPEDEVFKLSINGQIISIDISTYGGPK